MLKKIYITLTLLVMVITLPSCELMDDADNFITGIGAKEVNIDALAGEIGMSLGENPNASLKPDNGVASPASVAYRSMESMWLSPGKVYINNAYRGLVSTYSVNIRNGSFSPSRFSVTARECDYLEAGYINIPLSWVKVSMDEVIIQPGQSVDVPITITIPKSLPSKKIEFWVGIKDVTRSGMLKTELCSKWLINIR